VKVHRREFLLRSLSAASVALAGGCVSAPATRSVYNVLQQRRGADDSLVGSIAIVVNDDSTEVIPIGNSGVTDVELDSDAVFEIASITKVLTALLLVEMSSRGEVRLDDPVAKYLPPSVKLNERSRPITLLDLASYTSGLPYMPSNLPTNWWALRNPLGDYTEEKLYAFLSSYTPIHEPGTRYEYSNLGFGLLGHALARSAGKSYEVLLSERVCAPLGLRHTRITFSPEMKSHLVQGHDLQLKPTPLWDFSSLEGAGSVRASAKDLTEFLKVCMGFKQTPLGDSLTRLRQTRTHTRLPGTDAALGWFISSNESEEIVWKTGLTGGCSTFLGFSTRHRRGAVLLSNFVPLPLGAGTIELGMKLINPEFSPGNLMLFYR
jgi:serine-type D-Ala-D-Ala carboxypeptidase/endopeptidase